MSTKNGGTDYRLPLIIIACVVGVVVAVNLLLPSAPVQRTSLPSVQIDNSTEQAAQKPDTSSTYFTLQQKQIQFPRAAELTGISGYINADDSISIQKLVADGNIVLVDFWTYSCINCQRTTPYLNSWHETYGDRGLVIIGVHTPEFGFEKDRANVADAVEDMGIKYAVVQDNDYATWRAYDNRYWPRKYIVDIDGFVRYDHIGEGAYDQIEAVIKDLLQERADRLGLDVEMDEAAEVSAEETDFSQIRSPEIYFGYKFARQDLGNPEGFRHDVEQEYVLPGSGEWRQNVPYLGGTWYGSEDYVDLFSEKGEVGLRYSAKKVNIVAGGDGRVTAFVDGEYAGNVTIDGDTLYNVVSSQTYGEHSLRLLVEGRVQLYTFTFG